MNSRREFREIIKACGESSTQQPLLPKLFGALWLFILILLFSQNAFSQKNIITQEYDINDPRNPNCPCHKYQQMADNEYEQSKRQQENQFVLNTDNLNPANNNSGNNSSSRSEKSFSSDRSESSGGSSSANKRVKKKKSGIWIRKKINRSKLKHSKIKKLKPDYSVCYKW